MNKKINANKTEEQLNKIQEIFGPKYKSLNTTKKIEPSEFINISVQLTDTKEKLNKKIKELKKKLEEKEKTIQQKDIIIHQNEQIIQQKDIIIQQKETDS